MYPARSRPAPPSPSVLVCVCVWRMPASTGDLSAPSLPPYLRLLATVPTHSPTPPTRKRTPRAWRVRPPAHARSRTLHPPPPAQLTGGATQAAKTAERRAAPHRRAFARARMAYPCACAPPQTHPTLPSDNINPTPSSPTPSSPTSSAGPLASQESAGRTQRHKPDNKTPNHTNPKQYNPIRQPKSSASRDYSICQ